MPLGRMRKGMEPKRAPIDYSSGHPENSLIQRVHEKMHEKIPIGKRREVNQILIKNQLKEIEKELRRIDKESRDAMIINILKIIETTKLKNEIEIMTFLQAVVLPAVKGYVNEIIAGVKSKRARKN